MLWIDLAILHKQVSTNVLIFTLVSFMFVALNCCSFYIFKFPYIWLELKFKIYVTGVISPLYKQKYTKYTNNHAAELN